MAQSEYNLRVIEEFRANGGRVGGDFEGVPVLLLHTTGARSGEERVTPLVYQRDGERLCVFGSRGGSPQHPAWYHNVLAHPDVTAEVASETFAARATVLEGEERQRVFDRQKARYPAFADYERSAEGRVIPVVALERASG